MCSSDRLGKTITFFQTIGIGLKVSLNRLLNATSLGLVNKNKCLLKETHTHDKLLFVDLEIVSFLDTLGCIVQFQFKKS